MTKKWHRLGVILSCIAMVNSLAAMAPSQEELLLSFSENNPYLQPRPAGYYDCEEDAPRCVEAWHLTIGSTKTDPLDGILGKLQDGRLILQLREKQGGTVRLHYFAALPLPQPHTFTLTQDEATVLPVTSDMGYTGLDVHFHVIDQQGLTAVPLKAVFYNAHGGSANVVLPCNRTGEELRAMNKQDHPILAALLLVGNFIARNRTLQESLVPQEAQ